MLVSDKALVKILKINHNPLKINYIFCLFILFLKLSLMIISLSVYDIIDLNYVVHNTEIYFLCLIELLI